MPSAYLHTCPCHCAARAYIPTAGAKSKETRMRDCMEIIMRHSVWSSSKQFVDYLGSSIIFGAGRGLTAEDDLHITATSRYPRGSVVCGASRGGSNEDDLNITSTGRCPRGSVVSGAGRVGSHRQTSTLNSKPYVAAKSMKMTRTRKAAGRYSESSVTCGVDGCMSGQVGSCRVRKNHGNRVLSRR